MYLVTIVEQVAVNTARKYPLADPADIAQELWVWISSHPRKMVDWEAYEHGELMLRKTLQRVGSRYAQSEQEARRQLGLDRDTGQDY